MRRVLAIVTLLVLCLPLTGLATSTEKKVLDQFKDVTYSGSDGDPLWVGSWVESGEKDGPGSGQIRIQDDQCSNNKCLLLQGQPALESLAIARKANLSGFTTAQLSFEGELNGAAVSTGTFTIEARGNGKGWQTLATYSLLLDRGSFSFSKDVKALAGADFEVRLTLSSLVSLIGADKVFVDDVEIRGEVAAPTTTTSSTTSTTTSTTTTSSTTSTTRPKSTTTSTSTTSTSTTSTSTTTPTSVSSTLVEATTTTVSAPSGNDPEADPDAVTTTTMAESTEDPDDPENEVVADGAGPAPPASGLRAPAIGLMADYRPGSMGELDMGRVEVLGAELEADYALAVETFEAARIWLAVLSLLIAASLVSGVDRKRSVPRQV